MPTPTQHPGRNFIVPCLLSALFPFYAFFQMTVLNALAENRIQVLHLSQTGLGMLSSAYLYGDAFLLIPAGIILDRMNARNSMLVAFLSLLVSSSVFYFTNSFFLSTLARFVAGMAHAFALISCFRLAALYIPNNKQGIVISWMLTIAFLGGFFAQSPFVWLLQTIGLRNSAILQTMMGIVIFLILYFKINLPRTEFSEHAKKTNVFSQLFSALKNPENTLSAIYIALMSVPFMLLGALFGMEYLLHNKQLDSMAASEIVSLIFIGIIMGSPFFGWLYDQVQSKKRVMMTGVALTFISCWAAFHATHFIWLLFFAIGFFSSAQVLGYPVISTSNSKEIVGAAMGFANFFIMLLLGCLQLATGSLATHFSLESSLSWVIGISCFLSALCVVLL
ncbi:MAG TPA: MFS transporter [Gammaproteobacteria bacterium]|nr:MFS transporter [Gammaproteobacteria bacterium]